MPPPEEEKKPLPRPKEKPKPPKPKHKTGPEPKPRQEHAESHWTPGGAAAGGSFPPDPLSCGDSCSGPCGFLPHCSEPPPAPPATVHIRSSRLPTPLIALSASLLVFSAALLVALLVHRLVRRRRRQRRLARDAAAGHGDEEEGGHGHQVLAGAVAEAVSDGEEDADGGGGVHHVWYIRTKGLDERAIAAIAAVVYDAKKRGAGAGAVDDDGGGCAVCLAEFSDGETLRLLPRCGHAFHRGCIDTWLRAHVNCPLCRAPVQVAGAGAAAAAATATAASGGDQPERNLGVPRRTEDAERGGLMPERAVRRAASMVALPRRAWPDVSSFRAPASSSGREGDMAGLGKIMRLLKFSDAMEMAGMGAGRSVSFSAGSCHGLPTRSEPSAAGVSSDEAPQ